MSLSDTESIGSIGDMTGEEEEGTARGAGSSFLDSIGAQHNNGGVGAGMVSVGNSSTQSDFDFAEQDDLNETGPASTRLGPSTPRSTHNDQVDDLKQFPATARGVVGANTAESPHVRRKSTIPIDPTVLQELQQHKSLDES
jgi:serine/threonine-protein phosphatase 2A regulatory subunit B'